MSNEVKTFSQEELDAAIKAAKKEAADATLARATKGMVKSTELEAANTRATEAEGKLLLNQKLPAIKAKYKALAGKDDVFNDYFTKHKEALLGADEKGLEKVIKGTIKETAYAFDTTDGGNPAKDGKEAAAGSLLI